MSEDYSVEDAFLELKNESHLKGMHLMDRPFMPDEIGFVETPMKNKNESMVAIVHSRDGFNISRPIASDDNVWFIQTPEGLGVKMRINNMYEGLLILSSIGLKDSHPIEFVKKSMEEELPM